MAKFTAMNKEKENASPSAYATGSQAKTARPPAKSVVPSTTDRSKISLQDVRRGIILSEILGEPLSRRRKRSRWC